MNSGNLGSSVAPARVRSRARSLEGRLYPGPRGATPGGRDSAPDGVPPSPPRPPDQADSGVRAADSLRGEHKVNLSPVSRRRRRRADLSSLGGRAHPHRPPTPASHLPTSPPANVQTPAGDPRRGAARWGPGGSRLGGGRGSPRKILHQPPHVRPEGGEELAPVPPAAPFSPSLAPPAASPRPVLGAAAAT